MLKITVHESPSELRLQLEGSMSGPWVPEVEHCWLAQRSTIGRRRFVVDLTGVEFVDDAGQRLLTAMHDARAHFHVSGPMMRGLIGEISSGVR